MKIVLLIPSLGLGGAERVVVTLANELSRIRNTVTILTINNRETELHPFISKDINIINLGRGGSWKEKKKLLYFLNENKPDLLISNLSNCNIISGWAKQKIKNRYLTTVINVEHGIFSEMIKKNNIIVQAFTKYFVKKYYPQVDRIIAVSQSIKNDLKKYISDIGDKIVIINNPIDFNLIKALSKEKVSHPFFTLGEKIIVSVGRLSVEKGFHLLIEAYSKVKKEVSCRLLIIGSGAEEKRLKRLISQLQLENHVDIINSDPNPYKYIYNSDLLVSSSISEGFGLTILEALVCGVPVVATNAGGIATNVLGKTQKGILVPPGDAEALKDGILKGLKLGKYNIGPDLSEFSVENIVNKYLDLVLKM